MLEPVCFVNATNFHQEIGGEATQGSVLTAIKADRSCDEFVSWTQGFSPKEHAEMLQQQALREWQRERDDADRAWRERQADREHAWREQQADRERHWRKEDRRTAMMNLIVAAAVGLIGGAVTLIAANKLAWYQNQPLPSGRMTVPNPIDNLDPPP
ncbi:MAG: hypothetical protein SH850_22720 [Planctomycetaceae bacterium]|nr:hypothetical protein [Planctomycetaceae bacterium]